MNDTPVVKAMQKRILIVGIGFAGAVHARTLAAAGMNVHLIDRRSHIGGNAYDYVDKNGIRIHAYGPHLFHTKNERVLQWIRQFADFVLYTHRVRALLPNGNYAPLPINLDTVNMVLGADCETAEDVNELLAKVAIPIEAPRNAGEYLYSRIGLKLTDLFFRPYTRKMWSLDLEDMSAAVVARIPIRASRLDTYFPDDEVQILPRRGYTELFRSILDHPRITVDLNISFEKTLLRDFDYCFNSMAIDEYFDLRLGELPYRSIRFHTRTIASQGNRGWAVTNFTDFRPFTRETAWHELPFHKAEDSSVETRTVEEPCDYKENSYERYYPVRTADERYQKIYKKYRELATREANVQFIGRCGTYQYLDMDQVINQSLASAERWLASQGE